uniref:RNA-directed RNA polymerase n=1 Tax=Dali Totiv tick virus 1 TaxID=2972361 RepID=A0A9E7V2J9_9VIRU|nr:MAG: polyprotein [Dali Totiv tick virus 1]
MFVSNDDVESHVVDAPFVLPITRECVWGFLLRRRNITCWYVATKSISVYTPQTMSIAGGMISGNLRAGLTFENTVDYYSHIPEITDDLPIIGVDELYEVVSALPKTKITQQHHLYVNKQELRTVYEKYLQEGAPEHITAVNEVIHEMLMRTIDLGLDNRVTFITHLMYIFVAPVFAVYHLLCIMRNSKNKKEYMKILKDESGAAKQSQTVFRNDLAVIYELQVLFNRVSADVDWETEKDHRVNTRAVPIPKEKVYELATRIFKSGLSEGRKPFKLNWNRYWQERYSSMPNGSIVSQYDIDLRQKRELPKEAKFKSCWFAMNEHSRHSYWLERTPEIYATTSTKYEWGKVRALYGCDVTSFLHADYSMSNCEDTLPSCFPVGKFATSNFVKASVDKFKKTVPVCFDYDDFNSQHSIASMQAVMRAWIDVYTPYLTDEQVKSAEWTHDSLNHMTVNFNELNEIVPIDGTLMSGWRLTSYMNTVLNRVYLMHADLENLLVYSLHNGDDMFGGAPNLANALRLIKNAKDCGIRAQVSKTNLGTIGEFLRVDTRAKDPMMSQYLARAVSTLVHGRVEADAPYDLMAFVRATKTRCEEVTARGGSTSLMQALFDKIMVFASKLFNTDIDIINRMLTTHPVQGGICEHAPVSDKRIVRVSRVYKDVQRYLEKYSVIRSGIFEYIDSVRDHFGIPEHQLNRDSLLLKAYSALERDHVVYETGIESDKRIYVYRGSWRAWRGSGYEAPIAKVRSMGLIPAKMMRGLKNLPARLIRQSADPVAYMDAIT